MSKNFIMTIKTEANDVIAAIKKIEAHIKGELATHETPVHVDIKEEGQESVTATATPPPIPQAPAPQVGRAPEQKTTHNSWL